ncbi:hypothetical protein [Sphingomonas sp.]|jgi:hypothetical protein|nr:hypothetical protein [Sphingomonas sp.]HEU0044301.1 hypothetical protein [Sphingomonas sp.]
MDNSGEGLVIDDPDVVAGIEEPAASGIARRRRLHRLIIAEYHRLGIALP